MVRFWHKIKGGFMAVTAIVACPCHFPLTLPIIFGITGGTAFGAWMAQNTILIYTLATVYFIGGILLAVRWLSVDKGEGRANRRAPANVILVTSQTCSTCTKADQLWNELLETYQFQYHKVDINSGKGRSLASKHKIWSTPSTLIDGKVAFRGVPNRLRAKIAMR